jgi:hypothetical protein
MASVVSYKAIAPKLPEQPERSYVVDGIVPDRSGKYQAGPNAVILPSSAGSNNKNQ